MGKLTKSRVLQDGEGVLRGPKMRGWGKKIFSVMWGGDEVRQNHTGRGRIPHPLDPPHPIAISTLAHSMIVYSLSLLDLLLGCTDTNTGISTVWIRE